MNYKAVVQCEKSEEGYYYYYDLWDSVKALDTSELVRDWREKMEADTTMEYLEKNDMLLVAPGVQYTASVETAEQYAASAKSRYRNIPGRWSLRRTASVLRRS